MFVVYHVRSTMAKKSYKREYDAKSLVRKLNERESRYHQDAEAYAYADRDTYETKVVHMVERTNLLSGKTYMEKSNTPSYLSPSSESYWSS